MECQGLLRGRLAGVCLGAPTREVGSDESRDTWYGTQQLPDASLVWTL